MTPSTAEPKTLHNTATEQFFWQADKAVYLIEETLARYNLTEPRIVAEERNEAFLERLGIA